MRTLILISLAFSVANAHAQDEAAQTARFKSEATLCAVFYMRASVAALGSELGETSKRNAELFMDAARSAGATDDFVQGVAVAYTLLMSRALIAPEAQLKMLDQCEAMMDGPPR